MREKRTAEGEKVVIYGAGGLGREVLQIVRATLCREGAQVLGFVDDGVSPGTALNDAVVLGGGACLDTLRGPFSLVFGFASPAAKKELYTRLKENPLISFPNVVHPSASISEYARAGEGVVAAASSIVSVDAALGDCVFLNNGAMIGHGAVVGDFTSVMPMSAISGNVTIGEGCMIGAHAAIMQGLSIGRGCTVGMGAVVLRSVPDGATVLGNPAKRVS